MTRIHTVISVVADDKAVSFRNRKAQVFYFDLIPGKPDDPFDKMFCLIFWILENDQLAFLQAIVWYRRTRSLKAFLLPFTDCSARNLSSIASVVVLYIVIQVK